MSKQPLILAINPGSTSTKFAFYQAKEEVFKETIYHPDEELFQFGTAASQVDYRLAKITESLQQRQIKLENLAAVVGRGGFLKPLPSGTYRVDQTMLEDLREARYGEHASNLGAIIAYHLAEPYEIPAFIVDPVVVDELDDLARLSGVSEIKRRSRFHALNIKAVSRKIAEQLGKPYETLNFVVAHLGGGISVVAERQGRVVDVNDAINEGPYSPERAGTLPILELVKLCYAGSYSQAEMLRRLTRESGLYGYLGTKDALEIEQRIRQGDPQAKLVFDGMIYQIAKEIGAMATVLEGQVDGVILTGGLSHSNYITGQLTQRVQFLAPIYVVPGEAELEALACGALRVIEGVEQAKNYEKDALV